MRTREREGQVGGQVVQQPRRFYDGGTLPRDGRPGEPPDPGADPRIVLERHAAEGVETFSLERRLAYLDRHLGELLVPADPDFRTDLTSVPALFTWLVPKTGAHLPAALLHDALVAGRERPDVLRLHGRARGRPGGGRPDLPRRDGRHRHRRHPSLDRLDRRDRRDDLRGSRRCRGRPRGTGPTGSLPGSRSRRSSTSATARPATSSTGSWFGAVGVPWMGDRSWPAEVAGGLSGAIVVPLALSLLWGRLRSAGAIAGVMLAVLLHVTVGLALIAATYQALERLAQRSPQLAWGLAGLVVAAAFVTFALVSLG